MIEATLSADTDCIVEALRAIVDEAQVLTQSEDVACYLKDWTGQYNVTALAVIRPGSTLEVAELIKLCNARDIAVVPQGGRTGLCGGGVPVAGRASFVVSLGRMNAVRSLKEMGRTVIVEAGVVLETLHEGALQPQHAFGAVQSAQQIHLREEMG